MEIKDFKGNFSKASVTSSEVGVNIQGSVSPTLADIIVVRDLRKSFGQVRAVDGLSFSVREGELFGFLGPNGAGKTTTINLLTGLARPDSGEIFLAGLDLRKNSSAAKYLIGVVPDESNLYPELNGFGNLCFCAALYGLKKGERERRAKELLRFFGLEEAGDRKFADYSKGMKRKLTIAAGLIHQPKILFLDEPTTGIDVASARQIRQLIGRLNRAGTTIFLTTHYIEEAERLCQRIAFIVSGRIIKIDSLENLLQPLKGQHLLLISFSGELAATDALKADLAAAFPELGFEFVNSSRLRVKSNQTIAVGPLVRFFEERGCEIVEARRLHPSLEEVFVELTGIEVELMKKEKEKKKESGGD
ncbi:MAG TPA: ATP-binding cassette domain-containing protein [Candidatus Aminicenantes bacterium]|nr:ATP-binding cassette domain-containing protein [Candidatus Aminicenantes bacterium]